MLKPEDVKRALEIAAFKRGQNDHAAERTVNPYHPKAQATLHRKWDEGFKAATASGSNVQRRAA